MKRLLPAFLLIFVLIVGHAHAEGQKYTCPMHPHYIADRPGTCPICGMDLVALDSGDEDEGTSGTTDTNDSAGDRSSGQKKILYWQAPMNPNYRSDKPGKSPMGMDLVPVYADETESGDTQKGGRASVTIPPETIQNTGVRTETAQMASFGTNVRSYGDVTENIRLNYDISARIEGWINELRVQAIGDTVSVGDLLFTLFSPALVSAQQDLISAISTGSKGRITSTSKRLAALGVQQSVIDRIMDRKAAYQNVPFHAETDGVLSMVNVREGSFVKPGMTLLSLQNYSSVWIEASVAEKDVPFIDENTKARISLPTLGIKERVAQIDYIYPTIDRATRTGRVRLVLDNADGKLKPGAYADVEFETGVEPRLSIPSDAILKSKDGDFVVVALGNGRFQPRKILAGLKYKGRTEVLDGLSEGDNVVVSGQFLIDSESALKESFRKMQRMQKSLSSLEVSDDQMAMINHLLDAALYIHDELTAGYTPNPKMIMPALTLGDHLMPVFRGTKLQFILEDAEQALLQGKESLTKAEWQDTLNDLVMALKPWLLEGRPQYYKDKELALFMAHGEKKYWIQMEGEPVNPYDAGHPMQIDWPDAAHMQESETNGKQAGDGHVH